MRMRQCTLRKNTLAAYQIDTGRKPPCVFILSLRALAGATLTQG